MGLQPLYFAPGICKTSSAYASSKTVEYGDGRVALGRYIDANWMRFTAGFPESIGGQVGIKTSNNGGSYFDQPLSGGGSLVETTYALIGTPRTMCEWRDLNANSWLMIATDTHLYTFNGTVFADVTPTRCVATGNLGTTNPLTTSNGSPTITVADATGTYAVGDVVYLAAAAPFNGVTVFGWYVIQSAVPGTSYTITASTDATSGSSGGGTVAYQYPRQTVSNPFTFTAASNVVSVNQPSHGCLTGDWVLFPTAFTPSGQAPHVRVYGQYPITYVDANHYTIIIGHAPTSNYSAVGGATVIICNVHTPGLTPVNTGYGSGTYGSNAYGQSTLSVPTLVTGWTLGAYGSQMLSCPIGGTIYVYDPTKQGVAYPLLNAPATINAMFVTPERFVVALGINGSYTEMAWADQNDYTDWTSSATNTAETGRTLQGGSYFIGGLAVRNGASIIWTNQTTFAMTYSGDNNIYDTPSVADQCGLIGPWAAVTYGENAYWMSINDFWTWNGAPQQLPSDDIRDYVFQNINKNYQAKCVAGLVRAKKEVWFFYPDQTSIGENTAYVIYHTDSQSWSTGYVGYSAWRDADLFANPFAAYPSSIGANGFPVWNAAMGNIADVQQMEEGTNETYQTYITAAPLDVSNGDTNIYVAGIIPDFERITGDLWLYITSQYYPEGALNVDGPYDISATGATPRIDLRTDGKLIGFSVTNSSSGLLPGPDPGNADLSFSNWRLGLTRVDVIPTGTRR